MACIAAFHVTGHEVAANMEEIFAVDTDTCLQDGVSSDCALSLRQLDTRKLVSHLNGDVAAASGSVDAELKGQRVLVCFWGELRGIRASVDQISENLLDPLNADVAVIGQYALPDDNDRIELMKTKWGKRVKHAKLYQKIDGLQFYGYDNVQVFNVTTKMDNWQEELNTNMQIWGNFKMFAEMLKTEAFRSNYDIVVFSRLDFTFLYPYPSADLLARALGPGKFITQEGNEWGGVNYNIIAAGTEWALDFADAPYKFITTPKLASKIDVPALRNIETFWRQVFDNLNWETYRMPASCFIGAETISDRTTSFNVIIREMYNPVDLQDDKAYIVKYASQASQAFLRKAQWDSGQKWQVFDPPTPQVCEEKNGAGERAYVLWLVDNEDNSQKPERI